MRFVGGNNYVFNGADLSLLDGGEHNINSGLGSGYGVTFNNHLVSEGSARLEASGGGSHITLNAGLDAGNNWVQIGNYSDGTINFGGGVFVMGELKQVGRLNITGAISLTANGAYNGVKGVTTVNHADATLSFNSWINNNRVTHSNENGQFILQSGSVTFGNMGGLAVLMADGGGNKTAILNVSGGKLSTLGDQGIVLVNTEWGGEHTGQAIFLQSGGTVATSGIKFGYGGNAAASTVSALVDISGGLLLVGGDGIKKGAAAVGLTEAQIFFNASGGVIGALADWNSDVVMTLDGNATFQAADADGVARNITLNGALDGTGGFSKTGGGTLLLSGANTYAGDTIVSAGTLELTDVAALGGMADLSIFTGASIMLNYTGTAVIDSLLLDNAVIGNLVIGQSYTSSELNSVLSQTIFGGAGLLSISSIPEPSAWLLFGISAVLLAVMRRRRN
jgi:autotransporter-associated beta strand protein